MKKNLSKKNIIIFGASGGLGHNMIYELFPNVKNILLTYNKNRIKLRRNLNLKKKIFIKKVNFLSKLDIKNVLKFSYKKFKKIDIIIICNGYFQYDGLRKVNLTLINKFFYINVFSNIFINRYILQFKKRNDKVLIFNIGSSSSYKSFLKTILYCSSKHALIGAVKSINLEKKNRITNYIISTGSLKTKMGKKIKNQNYETFIDPKVVARKIRNIIISKKMNKKETVKIFRKIQ